MTRTSVYFTLLTLVITLVYTPATEAQVNNAAQSTPAKGKPNVAILIFNGVQVIDYTGPHEVFGQWGLHNVYTVAEKPDAITTNHGMRVIPSYTFDNHPKPDVLVIPGGRAVDNELNNSKLMKWIQDNAKEARFVLSVCNGAFFLAKAGLLDGLKATTTAGFIKELGQAYPNVKMVSDKRFVDNGKIVTTAGLTAGIDGALHVVSKLDGSGIAQMVALNMEYNWQPDSTYARASLADMKLPDVIYDVILPAGVLKSGVPISLVGNADHWEAQWSVSTFASASELSGQITSKWASEKNWSRLDKAQHVNATRSEWKMTDEGGASWVATANVEPIAGQKEQLLVTLKIVRGAVAVY